MIQVIQRAFTLLFAIAEEPQKVHGISELAELIHVQPSTCFHIVNSMLELGVVERVGKRKGYRLGPAVMKICRNNLYRPELVWKADPLFRAFAAEYRVKIELIVLQGKRRYILCHAEPEHTLRVDYNPLSCEDVLVTPSGKLLLAHAPEEVQKDIDFSSPILNPLSHDPRSKKQIAAYREKEKNRRKLKNEINQWRRYKSVLGGDMPKTFAAFQRHKRAGDDTYKKWEKEYRKNNKAIREALGGD